MKRPALAACAVTLCLALAPASSAITVHIMPDGSGDFPDIQSALDACVSGDTIMLAPGEYHERLVWPATDGLILKAEPGIEECILDGSGSYRPITIVEPVGPTTVIEGLTIQNGNVAGSGGAIFCSGAAPTIRGNVIRWCVVIPQGGEVDGGGAIALGTNASAIIVDNLIHDNSATTGSGGAIACANASPVIRGNEIRDCQAAAGGGIHVGSGANATIEDNEIDGNHATPSGGGGISMGPDAAAFIGDNWIHHNTTTWGGGIGVSGNCTVTIVDNLIEENSGQSGGGIFLWGAPQISGLVARNEIRNNGSPGAAGIDLWHDLDVDVRHNLITGNVSSNGAGGIKLDGAANTSVLIRHNVIHGNVGALAGGIEVTGRAMPSIEFNQIRDHAEPGIFCWDGGDPLVARNDIHGHGGSYGLQNFDPLVMVIAEDNWWGDDSGPYHATANPGGQGDAVSDHVDFDPWSILSSGDLPGLDLTPVLHQNHPNPFNPRTTIAFTMPVDRHVLLTLHSLDGRTVVELLDAVVGAGRHELVWHGEDRLGRPAPSGVYVCRLTCDEVVQTNCMVLVR